MRLSICIPTYNFGAFIGETLDSIIKQASDEVEIVVVDGASTDNTAEVVHSFQKRFSGLRYYCLQKKGGIDADLAKAVELAQGDYCWLMSSDDVLKLGAIKRVMDEIKLGYAVYLCNRTDCDRNLLPVKDKPWLLNDVEDSVFDFSNKDELIRYMDASQRLGALFSYMSSIVVGRKQWIETGFDEKFNRTNYAHVFRLFPLLVNGGMLKYIRDPLVLCRGDNDSFRSEGILNRFMIDFRGYSLLADSLFTGDLLFKQKLGSVMQREHVWYMLAGLRSRFDDAEKWSEFERNLVAFGYSRVKLLFIRMIGSSVLIMTIARYFRNVFKKR